MAKLVWTGPELDKLLPGLGNPWQTSSFVSTELNFQADTIYGREQGGGLIGDN